MNVTNNNDISTKATTNIKAAGVNSTNNNSNKNIIPTSSKQFNLKDIQTGINYSGNERNTFVKFDSSIKTGNKGISKNPSRQITTIKI